MIKRRNPFLGFLALATVFSGCGSPSGENAAQGDPKADLATIWMACKDHYRKTKTMPAPGEIPDGLAAKYNYESTAGISPDKHSTNVIAYESKPQGGKRYALFSDGRIEQVSDSELQAVGVDPDPLTRKKRTAEREEKEQREIDDSMRKAQAKHAQDEKAREEERRNDRAQAEREAEKARAEMEKKRRETEEQTKKQRQPESAVSPKSTTAEKRDVRTALRAKVSLKRPYPQGYSGAPTERISVQYAVKELLRQAGVGFDFEKSQAKVGELTRRWITPNISDKACDVALKEVLDPLGIDYDLEGGKVVLRRK